MTFHVGLRKLWLRHGAQREVAKTQGREEEREGGLPAAFRPGVFAFIPESRILA